MDEYFLQVLKEGEEPKWPRPSEELVVGSQSLDGGYTQFWAYPTDSGREAEDLPPAEVLASENKGDAPAILIDQKSPTLLSLILVKNGHAWAHTDSDEKNLEESISQMLAFAKEKYDLKIEHFMTTGRVAPEIEERLDKLEQGEEERAEPENETVGATHESPEKPEGNDTEEEGPLIRPVQKPADFSPLAQSRPVTERRISQGGPSSKLIVILPLLLILVVFGGAIKYKDKILTKFNGSQAPAKEVVVTPTKAPTPTPTPSVDRSEYQVRVLNGTTKAGAAGTLASELEEKGWEVLSKGNAKNQSTAQTTVSVKEGMDEVAEAMIQDLADFEATQGADLKESDKADVEVVIGKK